MQSRVASPIHESIPPDVKITVTLPAVSQRHLSRIQAAMQADARDDTRVSVSRAVRAALAALASAIVSEYQKTETD